MTVLTSNPLYSSREVVPKISLIVVRFELMPPWIYEQRHVYSFQLTIETRPTFLRLNVIYQGGLYMSVPETLATSR